jgi:hypothetical protein
MARRTVVVEVVRVLRAAVAVPVVVVLAQRALAQTE